MRKYILLIVFVLIIGLSSCKTKTDELIASIVPNVDTVTIGGTWSDAGCLSNGNSCSKIDGTVDTNTIGEYKIYYKAVNDDEEVYLMRVVTVVDDIPPVIALNPGVDTIFVGENWIDAGCTASDNYDTSVTCTVNSNTLNINIAGEYEIIYSAIDDSGNETQMTRYIFVLDE